MTSITYNNPALDIVHSDVRLRNFGVFELALLSPSQMTTLPSAAEAKRCWAS
jgi:hypothetical protein